MGNRIAGGALAKRLQRYGFARSFAGDVTRVRARFHEGIVLAEGLLDQLSPISEKVPMPKFAWGGPLPTQVASDRIAL